MRGMILAGGTGTRMRPLTLVTNKHLLPVWKYPMIYYPLHSLKSMGITEIMITVGGESIADVMRLLGSGARFGVSLSYRVQDQAGGIAEAIGLGEGFAGNQPIAVILGDNVFDESLAPLRADFERSGKAAAIILKEVPDPSRFGVAVLDPGGNVAEIVEKPAAPPSNWAVTGLYVYPPSVFAVTRTLKPSARGELEVTDLNNHYIRRGDAAVFRLGGFWSDAGTFESNYRATSRLREHGVFWESELPADQVPAP